MMRTLMHIIIALASVGFAISEAHAQDTKEQKLPERQERANVPLIKNPDATDFWVDGYRIDKRAVKYYYPDQLEGISIEKAKKINEIYLSSYDLLSKGASQSCLSWLADEFDLGPYNQLRKWEERVVIEIENDFCSIKIDLHSWKEINSIGLK